MIATTGRVWGYAALGLLLAAGAAIHFTVLSSRGINGWTGEPKGRYYEFRKWDKNIFSE